jgi:hypothetical protein
MARPVVSGNGGVYSRLRRFLASPRYLVTGQPMRLKIKGLQRLRAVTAATLTDTQLVKNAVLLAPPTADVVPVRPAAWNG